MGCRQSIRIRVKRYPIGRREGNEAHKAVKDQWKAATKQKRDERSKKLKVTV